LSEKMFTFIHRRLFRQNKSTIFLEPDLWFGSLLDFYRTTVKKIIVFIAGIGGRYDSLFPGYILGSYSLIHHGH